jgi:hypothetical protein
MAPQDEMRKFVRVALFVPVELQRRGYQRHQIFQELSDRAFEPIPQGVRQIQPWCRWQGLSQYLDCIAFADRSAREIPADRALGLEHVTPGRFCSVGAIFFAQALADNVAVWLCDAMNLPIDGGERNFRFKPFRRELKIKEPASAEQLLKHQAFIDEINRYRQVWIHTISGGAIPSSDVDPFQNPNAKKFLGVPLDPAIQPDQSNYLKRAEQCAKRNNGRYLEEIGVFTERVFRGASEFYLGWLRFALDYIK